MLTGDVAGEAQDEDFEREIFHRGAGQDRGSCL